MNIILRILSLVFLLIFLQGCVNNYEKFYKENSEAISEIKNNPQEFELLSEGDTPIIKYVNSDNVQDVFDEFNSAGYILIGESGFTGSKDSDPHKHMIEQAQKIGATVVVANDKFEGTITTTSTSSEANNINTNYYGSYGQGIGSALTTYYTPKTTTSSYDKYGQYAYYIAKYKKKLKFGLKVKNLTSDLKKKLGRNTGVLVDIVFNETPVFYANIMKGDVITRLDGVDVGGYKKFLKSLKGVNSKSVIFTILRDGEEIHKTVKLD
jgi:C-terminal processing protease CtpA/Prc